MNKKLTKILMAGMISYSSLSFGATVNETKMICFEDRISSVDWDANDFCMECNLVYDDAGGGVSTPGDISAACTPLTAGAADQFDLIVNPGLNSGNATFTIHRNDGNFVKASSDYYPIGNKLSLFTNAGADWRVNVGGRNNDPVNFAITFNTNHGLGSSFDISELFAIYNRTQGYLVSIQVEGAVILTLNGGSAAPEESIDFYDAYDLGSASVDSKCNPSHASFDMSAGGCDIVSLSTSMSAVSISGLNDSKVRKAPVPSGNKASFNVRQVDSVSGGVATFSSSSSFSTGFSGDAASFLSESSGGLSGYNLKKQRRLCEIFGSPCGGGSGGGSPAPGGGGLGAMPAPALAVEWGSGVRHTSLLYTEITAGSWNLEIARAGESHYEYVLIGDIASGNCPTDLSGISNLNNLFLSSSTQLTEASSGGYFHYGFQNGYVEESRSPWTASSKYGTVTSNGVFPGGDTFLVYEDSIYSGDTNYTAFIEHSYSNYGSWDFFGYLSLNSCSGLSTQANCEYFGGCFWSGGTCGSNNMNNWGSHGYLTNGQYTIPSSGSLCFYSVWATVNTSDVSTLLADSNTSVSSPTQGTIEIDLVDNNVDTSSSSACASVTGGSYSNVYDGDVDGVFGQCVEMKLGHSYGLSNQKGDSVSGTQIPITME